MTVKVGIGEDSHRFAGRGTKPLRLGGVEIAGERGLEGNSDADVVLHAVVNAVSGVSGVPVLGAVTDRLCDQGVTDSALYVAEALRTLKGWRPSHLSVSIECARPRLAPHLERMRERLAALLDLSVGDVAVTATSGEGLTAFGKGEGIRATAVLTAVREG